MPSLPPLADRFWTYTDPSRRQYMRRIAIWRTSFGEAIRQEFLVELRLARPIRWSNRRVARAEKHARHLPDAEPIDILVEQRDDRFQELHLEAEEAREERREYLPRRCRARRISGAGCLPSGSRGARKRNLGSERLLHAALELYGSARHTEELRARLGPGRRSPQLSHNPLRGWRLS